MYKPSDENYKPGYTQQRTYEVDNPKIEYRSLVFLGNTKVAQICKVRAGKYFVFHMTTFNLDGSIRRCFFDEPGYVECLTALTVQLPPELTAVDF